MTIEKSMLLDDLTPGERNLSLMTQRANQMERFVGHDHNLTLIQHRVKTESEDMHICQ